MKNKLKLSTVLGGAILGAMLFFATIPSFRERRSFFLGATVHNATIVQVEQEEKWRKKWGWFVAYIPVVQITDEKGVKVNLRVDDYSSSPVYRIGDKMEVLYNKATSNQCIVNTFSETWGDILYPLIASCILVFPLLHYIYDKRKRNLHKKRLIENKRSLEDYERSLLELSKLNPLTVKKRPSPFKRRRRKP